MAVDKVTDQLQKEIKSLGDMLEEVIDTSNDKSSSEFEKLRAKAQSIIEASRDTLSNTSDKFIEQTKEIANKADDYVHDKPWNGMGIAAAIGVVVGVLLSRR